MTQADKWLLAPTNDDEGHKEDEHRSMQRIQSSSQEQQIQLAKRLVNPRRRNESLEAMSQSVLGETVREVLLSMMERLLCVWTGELIYNRHWLYAADWPIETGALVGKQRRDREVRYPCHRDRCNARGIRRALSSRSAHNTPIQQLDKH